MASFLKPHWRNSKEHPPKMAWLERELIKLVDSDFPWLQQCLQNLESIVTTYCENQKTAAKGAKDGVIAAAAGNAISIVGLAFAPFTLGLSLAITGAAAAVTVGGATGTGVWNKKRKDLEIKFKQDFEAELRAFQYAIIPMARKMKEISDHIKEILRDLRNREHNASCLSIYFASASELMHLLKIYDANELSEILSETVSLSGNIIDMLAQLSWNCRDTVQRLLDVWSKCSQLQTKLAKIKENTDKM